MRFIVFIISASFYYYSCVIFKFRTIYNKDYNFGFVILPYGWCKVTIRKCFLSLSMVSKEVIIIKILIRKITCCLDLGFCKIVPFYALQI